MKYVHLKEFQKPAINMVNYNTKSKEQNFKTIVLVSNNYNCAQHFKDGTVIWCCNTNYNTIFNVLSTNYNVPT